MPIVMPETISGLLEIELGLISVKLEEKIGELLAHESLAGSTICMNFCQFTLLLAESSPDFKDLFSEETRLGFLGADFDRDKLKPYVNEEYVNAYKVIFGSADALSVCSQKTKDLVKEFKFLFDDSVEASSWCGIDIYNDVERAISKNRDPDLEKSECYLQAKIFLRYKFTKYLIDRINSLKRDKAVEFSEVEGLLCVSKDLHDKESMLDVYCTSEYKESHCHSSKEAHIADDSLNSYSLNSYNFYIEGAGSEADTSLCIAGGSGAPKLMGSSEYTRRSNILPLRMSVALGNAAGEDCREERSYGYSVVGSKSKIKARRRLGR